MNTRQPAVTALALFCACLGGGTLWSGSALAERAEPAQQPEAAAPKPFAAPSTLETIRLPAMDLNEMQSVTIESLPPPAAGETADAQTIDGSVEQERLNRASGSQVVNPVNNTVPPSPVIERGSFQLNLP